MFTFSATDVSLPRVGQRKIKEWLVAVIKDFNKIPGAISLVFCSDDALLKMNKEFLNHDYFTDIITFDYSDTKVSGDLFISIDRVKDNASELNVSFERELQRVMLHGVLHLCGLNDKLPNEKIVMRSTEERFLNLL